MTISFEPVQNFLISLKCLGLLVDHPTEVANIPNVEASELGQKSDIRLTYLLFRSAELFVSPTQLNRSETFKAPNGGVISGSVSGFNVYDLSQPVVTVFTPVKVSPIFFVVSGSSGELFSVHKINAIAYELFLCVQKYHEMSKMNSGKKRFQNKFNSFSIPVFNQKNMCFLWSDRKMNPMFASSGIFGPTTEMMTGARMAVAAVELMRQEELPVSATISPTLLSWL